MQLLQSAAKGSETAGKLQPGSAPWLGRDMLHEQPAGIPGRIDQGRGEPGLCSNAVRQQFVLRKGSGPVNGLPAHTQYEFSARTFHTPDFVAAPTASQALHRKRRLARLATGNSPQYLRSDHAAPPLCRQDACQLRKPCTAMAR